MEGNEIHEMFMQLNRESEDWDGNGDNPVDQWLTAREIDGENLVGYSEAVAVKIIRACVERGGVLDVDEVSGRVSAAFQLGFEVAAKRYGGQSLPTL